MSRLSKLKSKVKGGLEKGARTTGRGLLFAVKVVVNPARYRALS